MNIILIHGGWHGAWCWRDVIGPLRAAGHLVFAPTLTGLADRQHLLSKEVNLTTHVVDVIELIRFEELTDVILVGHSYGGVVIRAVADRLPDTVAGIIYHDAFIPEDGLSMLALMPPERSGRHRQSTVFPGGVPMVLPYSAAQMGVTEPDQVARLERLTTHHPLATFTEPWIATNPDHSPRSGFLRCLRSGSPNIRDNAARAKAEGWPYGEIDCGHDSMITHPAETVALIDRIARELARAG
jgi:pimeloyl-ACP methyl ester carboxylesterase